MIFVDANVFMYAVGRRHPMKERARSFLSRACSERMPLVTSAEVLQELLHAYLPAGRLSDFDAAMELATATMADIWPTEPGDVRFARDLTLRHRGLSARDLLHLASCLRRGVDRIQTFDRALAAAFES